MGRIWLPSVGEMEATGRRDVEMQALVVINSGAHVETLSSMGCPGGLCGGIVVNQGLSTKGGNRHLVEIEWAVEFLVG